jgi:site-specific DNA-methyltransferase (adenine-specific)
MVDHFIARGDSRAVLKKLKTPVNCIITDPPFGVDNKSNMATTESGAKMARKIANDESPEVAIAVFNEVMDVLLPQTVDNADLYIFTAHQVLKEWLQVADDLGRHGFVRSAILVWQKDGPGMGDLASWGMGHEFILFLKKGRRASTARRRSGVLSVPQVRPGSLIHPHEKPLPLLESLIEHSTSKGDFIVDPFAGSGSTIRAAKQMERRALGVEYDELNHKLANEALHSSGGMF